MSARRRIPDHPAPKIFACETPVLQGGVASWSTGVPA